MHEPLDDNSNGPAPLEQRILRHYESDGLMARIEAGWAALDHAPEALSAVDEFHIRGAAATAMLIERLDVGPDDRVLDVGSGIGGPARALARATGASVTGLDPAQSYCDVANRLSARLGLAERTAFVRRPVAEATDTFDAAWTVHVGMNVADKSRFYGDILSRLKPGATFLVYDFVRGAGPDPAYPLPWARTEAESFLATSDSVSSDLTAAGFAVHAVQDDSKAALSFMQAGVERLSTAPTPPPLGLHTVLGPIFAEIAPNILRGLRTDALRVALFDCRKPR